ncbi:winged helix-turn-helix domain-containing protein [Terracidiphilus gabretensis]|uniref:winged helix-turn-helix domain-containing protein n=1 Tax=Terracidiphilus gabretensis TaxID=1577687 RepID=UPI00071B8B4C|nr:winged helix-turn-helix domain-containing protein [Terracidiphilus gabretensis]
MPATVPQRGHFVIAEWTVEPELNAISRDGVTTHLEPKVMKVLLQLAMAPGQVLSKEHLIEAVWPDTFVSDDVLTRCISVLRREMHDAPHAPRYIQTIPKAGYRMVAEVRYIESQENHFAPAASEPPAATPGSPPSAEMHNHIHMLTAAPETVQQPLRNSWLRYWPLLAGAAAVFVLAAVGFAAWRVHVRRPQSAFNILPLTSYAGQQDQGAFSPDGTRVAFVWSKPDDNGSRNLFIKQIGSETLLRLTDNLDESDYSPAWSPDGTRIAYLSFSDKGLGIYVISSFGGPAQKLYTPHNMVHWEQRALSWSPDGKSLIFPDGVPSSIYMLPLDTLQAHLVTTPPHVWDGDVNPAFSPDGSQIAFIRAIEGAVRDIYIVSAVGGAPRQVTHDGRFVESLTWAADKNGILFSSDRGGEFALWKVALRGGEPQRLPVGAENAYQPAVSPATHSLLYTESSATWNILGFRLHTGREANRHREANKPEAIISSTQQDSAPSFAPDGSRFAFQSWRSGAQELWLASRDGITLRQLTWRGRGLTGSPSFSPDGQQVAFDSRPEGHSHILVVPAAGGAPREVTTGNSNDILPRWSADGQFIYFASNRSGVWQTWKVLVAGGQPQQVTTNGGYLAMESPDGKWLYFTKNNDSGLWRMPSGGGPETHILPQPADGFWGYWAVTTSGIYFLDASQPIWRIQFYEPATGRISTVAALDRHPPPYSGISVDRKEDQLLLTDEVNAGSHITLIQNFR